LAWGLVVAGLILIVDRQPVFAAPWAVGGVVIAYFGLKVVRPFAQPMWQWYHRWSGDEARFERVFAFDDNVERDPQQVKRHLAEALERYRAVPDITAYLMLPPAFGLFHGILWGVIAGALGGLDETVGISAATGAALGLLIGPVAVSFIASVALACMVQPVPGSWWGARLACRCGIAVCPVLFVPCVWYCLRRMLQERWLPQ